MSLAQGQFESQMKLPMHLPALEDTLQAGARLAMTLTDGAIVGLDGPMGAGKTSFVRGLAMALGVPSHAVASPTFTLVMEHALKDGRVLRHVDAWRLPGADALEELGWFEWAGASRTLTIVEWAGKIDAALGGDTLRLHLDYDEGSGRLLSLASGEMP
jgi:tRNA threonylcarbamoyladenosine biosynthesis protein TsaE